MVDTIYFFISKVKLVTLVYISIYNNVYMLVTLVYISMYNNVYMLVTLVYI